jgi:hypothetical protein
MHPINFLQDFCGSEPDARHYSCFRQLLPPERERSVSLNDRWPLVNLPWAWKRSTASPKANRYRVHECVFGVLAMESEPVDPRL